MNLTFNRLALLTLSLTFVVVVLGAYVRLSDAGLGCPDWPGCYGHVGVPDAAHEIAAAESAYPERPVEAPKAWKEMIHRYIAGFVGLLIGALTVLAWRDRRAPLPRGLTLATVGVVLVQIVFGALTVTLKVKPIIVTTHLMLGLTTLSLLFWMWIDTRPAAPFRLQAPGWLKPLTLVALVVLIGQIFLGGWTSTNYAALACPDFPACHASYSPKGDLGEAFKLWRGTGIDYEFGVLSTELRATIHLVHRYGALVLTLVVGGLAVLLLMQQTGSGDSRRLGGLLLAALALQVVIGVGLIHLQLPLWLADAHNGGAAVLLLVVLTLMHAVWRGSPAAGARR